MPNYFTLTLDTTGPANPSIKLNNDDQYTTSNLVTAAISTADVTTTGYQMQVWGDIDLAWGIANGFFSAGATDTLQTSAIWMTYSTSKQIQVTSGDATKNVFIVIRDDVNNPSAQSSDSIILNTTLPTVTVTSGPDVTKISKQAAKDTSSFAFQSTQNFTDYLVKVVSSSTGDNTTGVVIGTASGSTNMSGTGSFNANTPISCTIKGTDLNNASSGDGDKIIKIFVKNNAGQWSA